MIRERVLLLTLLATVALAAWPQDEPPQDPVWQASITTNEGTTNYETLSAAVESAMPGTLIMIESDFALTEQLAIVKPLTIHLNSHVISGDAGMKAVGYVVVLKDDATAPGGVLSPLSAQDDGYFELTGGRYYMAPAALAANGARLANGYKAQELDGTDGFYSQVLEMTDEEKARAAYEAGTSELTYTVNGQAQTRMRVAKGEELTITAPEGWKFESVTVTGCTDKEFGSSQTTCSFTPTDETATAEATVVPVSLASKLKPGQYAQLSVSGDIVKVSLGADLALTLRGVTVTGVTALLLDVNGFELSEQTVLPYKLGKFTGLEAGRTYYLSLSDGTSGHLVKVSTADSQN